LAMIDVCNDGDIADIHEVCLIFPARCPASILVNGAVALRSIKSAGPVDKRQRAELHVKSSQGTQNCCASQLLRDYRTAKQPPHPGMDRHPDWN
ncbi:hypothetical protein, partial [Acetobacter sp.]|uniref:hypothetical protein n=1 Tax=Acetobacter sp. TaxID=440 RepID=UPI0039E8ABB7